MKTVGFLTIDPSALSREEQAAWKFLCAEKRLHVKSFSFSEVARKPALLCPLDSIWWHDDTSSTIPAEAQDPSVVQALKAHVNRGGGLLLTLLAAQYVVDLGLENVRPNRITTGVWAEHSWVEGYPDIRGFAGFSGHPIFANSFGGPYTWSPSAGEHFSSAFYEDELPQSGKVVAVEKLYIKMNERRRIIVEHQHGKGVVLSIGSHLYFQDDKQRFRKQLEAFALGSILYVGTTRPSSARLTDSRPKRARSYWTFDHPTVTEFHHTSKTFVRTVEKLPRMSNDLAMHRDFSSPDLQDQFFDLSGRKTLIVGKERGGISEVWCHPVRILQDVKVGFRIGDLPVRWSGDLDPIITIRPESLTRRYAMDGATIEEVIFADVARPGGAVHYQVCGRNRVEVIFTARIDLRLMWPLSENATGSLKYAWDQGLRAVIVSNHEGDANLVLGCSANGSEWKIGHYAEISFENGHLAGRQTDRPEVAVGFSVIIPSGSKRCAFVFAGSHNNLHEAVKTYRAIAHRPAASLRNQVRHFRALERESTQVITPGHHFNNAYRWSLVGIDRLFAESGQMGGSYLAGYGLSTSGWDGGHSISGRPGYAWFFGRDSVWTSFAVLDYGDYDKVRSVLELLGGHQDVDGKIFHELTTSGFAHYDAADSTPLYLILMGRYVRATGDRAFARRHFRRIQKAVQFCYSTDSDGDHLIENTNVGHGWVEGGRLFPVHTEHYLASCWAEALKESSLLAEVAGDAGAATKWRRESELVRETLERDFWNPRTEFYNFGKMIDGSPSDAKTILPAVGMYFEIADRAKSRASLAEYASDKFTADWGVRIVDKNDPMFNPTGYNSGSIWPLFTGWTSLAEFASRRPLQAFSHLICNILLFDQFSGGFIEEVLNGDRFQPAGVCHHQGWSESMVLQPVLEGMLGIKVDGLNGRLNLRPYLPLQWGKIRIRNIHVGKARIHMAITRGAGETVYTFRLKPTPHTSGQPKKVELNIQPFLPLGTEISDIFVGSRKYPRRTTVEDHEDLPLIRAALDSKLTIRMRHTGGVALIPPIPHLSQGMESRGLRIIEETWRNKSLEVILEGRCNHEYLVDVYDPSRVVRLMEGATLVAGNSDHLILAVAFPGDKSKSDYARNMLRLVT